MKGLYEITLRSKDGSEKRIMAYLPTEETKHNFMKSAERRGLEIMFLNTKQ